MTVIPPPPVGPGPRLELERVPEQYHKGLPRQSFMRKKLQRRLETGNVCGNVLSSGYVCVGTPVTPGSKCWRCTPSAVTAIAGGTGSYNSASVNHGAKASVPQTLRDFLKTSLSIEDSRLVDALYETTSTLDDVIVLYRIRLMNLEDKHKRGLLLDADYLAGLQFIAESLRKAALANSLTKLRTAMLKKIESDPMTGDDAYDPVMYIGTDTGG